MTISLALICSPNDEEAAKLDRCLSSVGKHVDEVCVTITGDNQTVGKVCKRHNAKVSHFKWANDFAAARNYNFSQCTGDWILWLDADDVVRGADNIRKSVTLAEETNCSGLQMLYEYLKDDNGNVVDAHWRTQLVKNDGHAHWVGKIHEDLLPKRGVVWAKIDDVVRVHTATREDNLKHHERNLVILEAEMEANPDEPRTYVYAGRAYLALKRYEDALKTLSVFIQKSGWDEERYEAKCLMGECFEKLDRKREALMAYNDALLENERCPYAHVYKARVYLSDEKWLQVLTCINQARAIVEPTDGVMHRPMLMAHDAKAIAALAHLHLGNFDEANELAEYLVSKFNTEHDRTLLELATKMRNDENLAKTYKKLGDYLHSTHPELVEKLLEAVPSTLADDPRILSLQRKTMPCRKWPKNSIAVYCGVSAEEWSDGDQDGKGIGGSETAVIELTRRFAAKGWEVVVYNGREHPPEGKTVNGVTYKNVWTFNKADHFDVLWLWRMPMMLDVPWNARKVIFDMHDVGNSEDFTPERIARMDYFFVKTQYHRSLYPQVPDEKVVVVGNGIDLDRFWNLVERNPKRIIYSSAPNRGLEHILDWWPDIRKAVPDAELHVFYGWETFEKVEKDNPQAMAWMQTMKAKLQQDGITYHGRVGQKQLAKEMLASGVWLYPTEFPEIDCITAREMQAAGVYPITSGFAALKETQLTGEQIPVTEKEEYIQAIKDAMSGVDRDAIQKAAQSFSWDKVMQTWYDKVR
jgi:tetratricopeptide (TPR) repeat protein